MNRAEAIALAERKANEWGRPYRVLRCTEPNEKHRHMIEPSDSQDSPRGWQLVEVYRPGKPRGKFTTAPTEKDSRTCSNCGEEHDKARGLSYDGFGINLCDAHRTRLATFTAAALSNTREHFGPLWVNAETLRDLLAEALPAVEEAEQFHKATRRDLSKKIRAALEAAENKNPE